MEIDRIRPYYHTIVLSLLIIVGSVLRLLHLSAISFWMDEAYTIVITTQLSFWDMIAYTVQNDNHPPLYYILMHLWFKLVPVTELTARLPSVVFGILSIPASYAVGKEWLNKQAGLVGATFTAISVFHVRYSMEARMYTMFLFFSLLALYLLMRYLNQPSPKQLRLMMICTVLVLYTHAYGIFVLMTQIVVVVSRRHHQDRLMQMALGIETIMYLPVIYFAYRRFLAIRSGFWIQRPPFTDLYFSVISYFGTEDIVHVLLVLLFVQVVVSRRFRGDPTIFIPIFLIMVLPFLFSLYLTPIYVDKYAIVSSVFIFVGVGHVLEFKGRIKYLNLVGLVLIVILALSPVTSFYQQGHHDDWQAAMSFVDDHAGSDDLLVLHRGGFAMEYLVDYYGHGSYTTVNFPDTWDAAVSQDNLWQLQQQVVNYTGVFVIYSRSIDHQLLIVDSLNMDHNLTAHEQFRGIEIYYFEEIK